MEVLNKQLFVMKDYESDGHVNIAAFGQLGVGVSFKEPVDMEYVRFLQCLTCKNIDKCMKSREKEPPVEELCPKYVEDKEALELVESQMVSMECEIPWERSMEDSEMV